MARFYEVGGCVRDEIMGLPTKDIDFAVEMEGSFRDVGTAFDFMRQDLMEMGFKIHAETPDKFVIRAGVPEGNPLRARTKDADFVLCRQDGPYSDGRRPDWVRPASLHNDLSRRDFTVNAIAKDPITGLLIDPHDGRTDIQHRILRFVGDPQQRIIEDGLRVVRGLRFIVTKDLNPEPATWSWMNGNTAAEALSRISLERINDEISRMFEHDTIQSIAWIDSLDPRVQDAIFRKGFHLTGSLKQKGKK